MCDTTIPRVRKQARERCGSWAKALRRTNLGTFFSSPIEIWHRNLWSTILDSSRYLKISVFPVVHVFSKELFLSVLISFLNHFLSVYLFSSVFMHFYLQRYFLKAKFLMLQFWIHSHNTKMLIYRVFFITGPPPKISKYRKVNLG